MPGTEILVNVEELRTKSDEIRSIADNLVTDSFTETLSSGNSGDAQVAMFNILDYTRSFGNHCRRLFILSEQFMKKVADEYEQTDEDLSQIY